MPGTAQAAVEKTWQDEPQTTVEQAHPDAAQAAVAQNLTFYAF
jgi:hypothetical protein